MTDSQDTDPSALGEMSAERFRSCEGQDFLVAVEEDREIVLELTQIRVLKGDTPRKDRTPFSLTFRGPGDVCLQQQIVPMKHADLGELALFLVPLGPDPDAPGSEEERGLLYEAVFT